MEMIMKRHAFVFVMLCACISVFAQATDLVIDNQTPGWLSSKINYGDQQTVRNLKVTGYLNDADLQFIGTLASDRNLNGILDLGDANIVGTNASSDNLFNGTKILPTYSYDDIKPTLEKFVCPRSIKSANNVGSGFKSIDSLVFDCMITNFDRDVISINPSISHIILGEGIDSISDFALSRAAFPITSVHLPRSLKYIGTNAFLNSFYDISKTSIDSFPSLEYLGNYAFVNEQFSHPYPRNTQTLPDTIFFPQIQTYYITAFDYKQNMHIYLGDKIEEIYYKPDIRSGSVWKPDLTNVYFHLKSSTPPRVICKEFGYYPNGITFCIPKGSAEVYRKVLGKTSFGGSFTYNLIEEDVALEQIVLTPTTLTLDVEESSIINVVLVPNNVTDKTIIWSVEDATIASITQFGEVRALSSGETDVYAKSPDGKISAKCHVHVNAHAETVTVNTSIVTFMNIGETFQLEAIVKPNNSVDKSVTWKSSNESVCTVSDSGLVTATGVGAALVVVTTVDGGLTAICTVKVIQHVTDIALNTDAVSLKVGVSDQLRVIVNPANADNRSVIWSSSDDHIATVDNNGNVTTLKAGETWIKVVSEDNAEAKDSCRVTVVQPVTGILLSKESYTFDKVGENMQLAVIVEPADATNKEVNWSSSNESVCVVSNEGLVTSVGAGTASVKVTSTDGGYSASCIIKVSQHVSNISLNKNSINLKTSESEHLVVTVLPADAENKSIIWSSADEQTATVDANGNVTALKAGETWIKVVSEDNAKAKDSCRVTVIQPVTGIELSQTSCRLTNIGEFFMLDATVLPNDATDKGVRWTSSDEAVCVVANGKVVAMGFGTAVVMAVTVDGNFMATCTVIVEKELIPVTNVILSMTSATMEKGETMQLEATVVPSDATDKTLIWKTSDESVCAVTQSGLLIAISEGRAVITAVPERGVGQAQCDVLVTDGMNAVKSVIFKKELSDNPIYDTMGRRVTQLVKGHLYISNGRKFIAK